MSYARKIVISKNFLKILHWIFKKNRIFAYSSIIASIIIDGIPCEST